MEHVALGWAPTKVRQAIGGGLVVDRDRVHTNLGERAPLGRFRPALRERIRGYC